jgi:hypothetical protein
MPIKNGDIEHSNGDMNESRRAGSGTVLKIGLYGDACERGRDHVEE